MKKTGRKRSQAVERAPCRWTDVRRTGWFLFRGVTRSYRVRKEGPVNEARSLTAYFSVRSDVARRDIVAIGLIRGCWSCRLYMHLYTNLALWQLTMEIVFAFVYSHLP